MIKFIIKYLFIAPSIGIPLGILLAVITYNRFIKVSNEYGIPNIEVRKIQQKLNMYNDEFNLKVDGILGDKTLEAINSFKSDMELMEELSNDTIYVVNNIKKDIFGEYVNKFDL